MSRKRQDRYFVGRRGMPWELIINVDVNKKVLWMLIERHAIVCGRVVKKGGSEANTKNSKGKGRF
jgi:hypothetical protein